MLQWNWITGESSHEKRVFWLWSSVNLARCWRQAQIARPWQTLVKIICAASRADEAENCEGKFSNNGVGPQHGVTIEICETLQNKKSLPSSESCSLTSEAASASRIVAKLTHLGKIQTLKATRAISHIDDCATVIEKDYDCTGDGAVNLPRGKAGQAATPRLLRLVPSAL